MNDLSLETKNSRHGRFAVNRRWLGVVALAALSALALGCDRTENKQESLKAASSGAEAKGEGPMKFAFVTNNSSDFWNIAEKGLQKAEKDFGIKTEIFRPLKGEVADQQRFLEDIMVLGFEGVAISPINPDAMTPVLDKVAAKMPLVCHDSDAPKSQRKTYVGTNNVEAGKAAGEAALAALEKAGKTKGKAALFVGRIDMQNSIERKRGVDAVLSKMSDLEVLPVFLDHTDRAKAKKNVEDALVRYPDLILAIGLWNYNGPAIAGAVRESSREDKPVIVAFDEDEETLKGIEEGVVFATIVQKPFEFGYQSVRLLKEINEGKKVPDVYDTGIITVKKDNLKSFWGELKELKK